VKEGCIFEKNPWEEEETCCWVEDVEKKEQFRGVDVASKREKGVGTVRFR